MKNCYISVVIQSLAGTVCQRFIPSTLESNSQLISALNVRRNKLTTSIKDSRVNLSKEFTMLSKQILDVDLRKKEHHDAFEFLEKLLDKLITENLFVDQHFTYPLFNIIKCLSCNFIAREVIKHQKDIIMPIPEQQAPLTLENLIYSKFFCGIHEQDERTHCNEGCSGKVHETLVLGAAPKDFIVCTARNTSSTGYCLKPVEVPYCLYFDQFLFESCGSITYTLVSVIYRYGSHLSTSHFNCILFNRYGICCSFDDTNETLYDTEVVLRDLERQRHTHIAIYVQEKSVTSHFYPIYDNLQWSYDASKLEVVENVFYQSSKLMDEVSERDIFNLLKMGKVNGDVINSFLTSLIRTNTKIKAGTVTPLLPHILLNISKAEERHIFMKYILADDFLDNDMVFWHINVRNIHWVLLIIYPKLGKGIYFDSMLSVMDVKQTLAPIFQYIKCYYQIRKLQKKWRVYVHSLTPQQSNDIDCSIYICINVYKSLHYHNHVDEIVRFCQNENLAIRCWIAFMCLVNANLTTPVTFTCEQKEQIKEKINFTIFQEDPEFDIVDVKDCFAGLKFDNEWDALLTAKLEKQVTKRISDPEDNSTSTACRTSLKVRVTKMEN